MGLSTIGKHRRSKATEAPPVILATTTLFSGTYNLTTSLADISAGSYNLNPSLYTVPTGRNLQYRLTGVFTGSQPNPGDWTEFSQRENVAGVHNLFGASYHAGWQDDGMFQYDLLSIGSVTTTTSPLSAPFATTAANFNGSSMGLRSLLTFAPYALPAFTLEFMFKRGRTGTVEALGGVWDNVGGPFLLYLDSSDRLTFVLASGGSSTTITGAINTSTYHWVALSWDGANNYLYLDGTKVATVATAPGGGGTNLNFAQNGGLNWFQGIMGYIRWSWIARYTGSTYTLPTTPFVEDYGTLGAYPLSAAPPANQTVSTGWTKFPASTLACTLYARNRMAARGTLNSVTLEVRHAA